MWNVPQWPQWPAGLPWSSSNSQPTVPQHSFQERQLSVIITSRSPASTSKLTPSIGKLTETVVWEGLGFKASISTDHKENRNCRQNQNDALISPVRLHRQWNRSSRSPATLPAFSLVVKSANSGSGSNGRRCISSLTTQFGDIARRTSKVRKAVSAHRTLATAMNGLLDAKTKVLRLSGK